MNPWNYDYYYPDQTGSRLEGVSNEFNSEDHEFLTQMILPGLPPPDIPLYPIQPRYEDNNSNSLSLNTPPPPSPQPLGSNESSVAIKSESESPPLFDQEQTLFNIGSFLEDELPPSGVPPLPSLPMHYSLNPYAGPYNFTVTIPTSTDMGLKPKWCNSPVVNKVYAAKRVTFPINIKMERFLPEASIIICPIYSTPSTISLPVKRCYLCETSDAVVEAKRHIIQVEGCPCKYFERDNRCMAVVGLPMPAPGDSSSQLLVKMACNTSCVGGPTRRLFSIMLTLVVRNEEVGRQVIHTKCCESPIRDMRRDESDLHKISSLQPKTKDPESVSKVGPQKRQKNGEGSLNGTKEKKIKTEIAIESQTSLDYLWVPSRFHKKVKRYLNFLYKQEQCKQMKVQMKKLYPSATESD